MRCFCLLVVLHWMENLLFGVFRGAFVHLKMIVSFTFFSCLLDFNHVQFSDCSGGGVFLT